MIGIPFDAGNIRGDMAVSFSCDPENAERLVDLALDEVESLQAAGPTQTEVRLPPPGNRAHSILKTVTV